MKLFVLSTTAFTLREVLEVMPTNASTSRDVRSSAELVVLAKASIALALEAISNLMSSMLSLISGIDVQRAFSQF